MPTYQTVMASEVEPPFVSAAENKGWLHSAPEQLLAYQMQCRVRSLAAPATGARRSGRHDIPLGIFGYTNTGAV